MSGKSINFDDKKINKSNFYKNKNLFKLNAIDVNKILVAKKESYSAKNSLKYFIGYNADDVIRPLCIILPQMIGYVMGKISNLLNIEFDSEPIYGDGDKYIKTKIKMYGDRVNTNFQSKKLPIINNVRFCY